MSILIFIGALVLAMCWVGTYVKRAENRNGESRRFNRSPDDHLLRMVNKRNAPRIFQFVTATSLADFARIDPLFMTLDISWGCNLACVGCIDKDGRDGLPVVRQRHGEDPAAPRNEECTGPFLRLNAVRSAIRFAKYHSLRCIQLMGGETLGGGAELPDTPNA